MFLVNKSKNEAVSLERKIFQEIGFKERKHLQEWICKNTETLGERENKGGSYEHKNKKRRAKRL